MRNFNRETNENPLLTEEKINIILHLIKAHKGSN